MTLVINYTLRVIVRVFTNGGNSSAGELDGEIVRNFAKIVARLTLAAKPPFIPGKQTPYRDETLKPSENNYEFGINYS